MSTDDMNTPTTTDDDAVPLLDRNLYRTIKKMNRSTLEGLLNDLFERGRKKGLAEAGVTVAETEGDSDDDKTLDLRAVEADIKQMRGIGEKRAEEIMRIFEKHLGGVICYSQGSITTLPFSLYNYHGGEPYHETNN